MIQSSKSSGARADEVYVSPWKFYESLDLFSDAFTPQKTESNANDEMMAHPMFRQNLLPLEDPINLLRRKIMSFIEL